MSKDDDTTIRRGGGNVFSDLGYTDADTHLLKAELVSRVQAIINDQGLTQTDAALVTGVSQPDISRILKGHFRDVSVERIMRMLIRLGCDVDIVVRARGNAEAFAPIHMAPAAA